MEAAAALLFLPLRLRLTCRASPTSRALPALRSPTQPRPLSLSPSRSTAAAAAVAAAFAVVDDEKESSGGADLRREGATTTTVTGVQCVMLFGGWK